MLSLKSMSRHFEKELNKLKERLLSLSFAVEENFSKAVLSVKNRDEKLAKEVIQKDTDIDLIEVELEEDCLKILALHQPVAIDLRMVVAALKINNDLERIGDLAVNIAERSIFLCNCKPIQAPFDFETMAKKTRSMIKQAIDSLIQMDSSTARKVCSADDEIDQINREMYQTVYEKIRQTPDHVSELIQYLSISRHLERIADYATNIAEDIIYMIEGSIVRHQPEAHS